jgi:membrane protease YdiL (CAAX protease family)
LWNTCVFFYGFLFAAGWVWVRSTGQDVAALWTPKSWALEIAVGVGAALVMIAATGWLVARVRPVRELEREFGWMLGEQRAWECALLAMLSGVAEELFFRGAALAAVGPALALAVFALLHWPINGQFRAWPVTALVAGVVLTAERLWTGTIVAAAITHALVNGVNLYRISRKYRVWVE